MTVTWQRLRRWRWEAAGLAAVVAFAVLAGRFWHPYYGFTKFVQLDESDAAAGIPEIRAEPVFVYEGFNGYDGAAYTQIAFHPLLDSPELRHAVGNLPYRARRILGSALAWLVAGGNPARVANAYASLNLAVWLALALVMWRVLPVTDARSWTAWAGLMFSAGALHSVRLALTDLLAAVLVATAISLGERQRSKRALVSLAAAGLARETALAGVVGLWRGPWDSPRAWVANLARSVIVMVPLAGWILFLRWKVGPGDQGFGNFTWPLVAWLAKGTDTLADYARQPAFRWLNTTTLLASIALTAQALFFLRRLRRDSPWWRVGAAGVAMMLVLGTSVWEGHPGAATRVLLPMSVAFAVLAVRHRAGWGWLIAGGLGVFSGVLALWQVPDGRDELAAGCSSTGSYVVMLGEGWHGLERNRKSAWAWTAHEGELRIELSPRTAAPVRVRVKASGISPRDLQVRQEDRVLWRGDLRERADWLEVTAVPHEPGRLRLTFESQAAPVSESGAPNGRALGFALHDVEVR